jgi:pimeloyl-ACP methyl ester carboxylesterase
MVRFLNRLGGFARVILFDKRGSGVSDPVPLGALQTLEQWTDDARVVMDAAGSERPALIGDAEGGPRGAVRSVDKPPIEARTGVSARVRPRDRCDETGRMRRARSGRQPQSQIARAIESPPGRGGTAPPSSDPDPCIRPRS